MLLLRKYIYFLFKYSQFIFKLLDIIIIILNIFINVIDLFCKIRVIFNWHYNYLILNIIKKYKYLKLQKINQFNVFLKSCIQFESFYICFDEAKETI